MEATFMSRRSSTGRSNIIENCIVVLKEAIKGDKVDLEDLSIMVINNTMPAEFRSTAWKIFLGILPNDKNAFEWVKIIQNERSNFEKLSGEKEVEEYIKVIRNEAEVSTISQSSVYNDYQQVLKELEKISMFYDFFKSQIVAETLLRLYIIWRRQNPTEKGNIEIFYILAGVIFALYPSIIHFTTDIKVITSKEEADPKTLFYFLNDEEFFDADVYMIFDHLMNKKGLKSIITQNPSRNSWESMVNLIVEKENIFPLTEDLKEFISTFNRAERVAYLYLKIANPKLLSHMMSIKLDPYEIIQLWFNSLFTSSICYTHIVYFWDNIFLRCAEQQDQTTPLAFADFIGASLINNLGNDLLTADLITGKKILMRYPEHSLNLKDIIKRALKLREKVTEELVI